MQQKRKWRSLGFLRKLLTCAIGSIALMALFSAYIQVFPPPYVQKLPESSYRLPTQHETGYQKLSRERSWRLEFAPPHLSKTPLPPLKLDNASGSLDFDKLWKPPPNLDYAPCVEPNSSYTGPAESRGYLLVHTNGGLNQMRAGICDMVAVARIINAILVIPELDKCSFWQDSSNFSDVFDEDHFINSLANDVKVTEEQLAALFITCGQVVDCRICGDPNSVLRFAFVEFTDEEGARNALSLAGTMLGYYPVRSEDEREMCARTIYCTNIDKKVTQADVKLFFESICGEVHRLRLLGDYHHSTRIAFVEFVNLREDSKKGVYVENLSEFEVQTVGDILRLLSEGSSNRKVAATNMNREQSFA